MFLIFVAMEIVYFTILYITNSWVFHSIKTKYIYKRHITTVILQQMVGIVNRRKGVHQKGF